MWFWEKNYWSIAMRPNFSGVGTRGDPYLIEGYKITSHGTPSFGIDISNTNALLYS